VSYRFDVRDFRDDLGDSHAQTAWLSYGRGLGRRSTLRLAYGYLDQDVLDSSGWIPLTTHSLDVGLELERRLSATRRVLVTFGGGATQGRSVERNNRVPFELLVPSAFAAVRVAWARTWSVSGDYRRAVGTFDGLSSEPFEMDTALVHAGGFVGRRAELTFSVGYSDGRAPGSRSGALDTYIGTSQLRFAIGRQVSAVFSHSYSRYSLRGIETLLAGLPREFDRNAIRVGLSLNVPIAASRRDAETRGSNAAR
jgi:hypothetical protein